MTQRPNVQNTRVVNGRVIPASVTVRPHIIVVVQVHMQRHIHSQVMTRRLNVLRLLVALGMDQAVNVVHQVGQLPHLELRLNHPAGVQWILQQHVPRPLAVPGMGQPANVLPCRELQQYT